MTSKTGAPLAIGNIVQFSRWDETEFKKNPTKSPVESTVYGEVTGFEDVDRDNARRGNALVKCDDTEKVEAIAGLALTIVEARPPAPPK